MIQNWIFSIYICFFVVKRYSYGYCTIYPKTLSVRSRELFPSQVYHNFLKLLSLLALFFAPFGKLAHLFILLLVLETGLLQLRIYLLLSYNIARKRVDFHHEMNININTDSSWESLLLTAFMKSIFVRRVPYAARLWYVKVQFKKYYYQSSQAWVIKTNKLLTKTRD